MKPNFRILVIDDEKIVCDRLSMELERAGFEVEAFSESAQALQRISAQPFDLVITDIKMRGPNGIEIMNFIRENYRSTRVIVITGFATVDTARQVLAGGAVEFIPKPFKISQLREVVQRLAAEKAGEGHFHERDGKEK
ncbi:MAG TPA: response regulator [Terriglobales bacterium]|nr:response regulator [Terriglobales bacterium]